MKNWLQEIREGKGLTQQQVADAVKISRGHYANIENGRRCESDKVDTEKAIAAALDFDWTLFFEDEAEPVTKE